MFSARNEAIINGGIIDKFRQSKLGRGYLQEYRSRTVKCIMLITLSLGVGKTDARVFRNVPLVV